RGSKDTVSEMLNPRMGVDGLTRRTPSRENKCGFLRFPRKNHQDGNALQCQSREPPTARFGIEFSHCGSKLRQAAAPAYARAGRKPAEECIRTGCHERNRDPEPAIHKKKSSMDQDWLTCRRVPARRGHRRAEF